MKIIEHKIGETFCLEDGTKLEIAKSVCDCRDCYFFNSKNSHCSRPKNVESCHPLAREDKEFIMFKQVKDNNMEEKRSIKISLEEAKEWYNSGDSFKKELALKAYKEIELRELSYSAILDMLPEDFINKNIQKYLTYVELINVASYLNSICPPEYCKGTKDNYQYIISGNTNYVHMIEYKGFKILRTSSPFPQIYLATFNSEEAAKKAIDILGDELNVLFK